VDATLPLLGFLFLVAFGVDYNIFLISRARQEATVEGHAAGHPDRHRGHRRGDH